MAATTPNAYRVKGPVAVIRKAKHERYVNRGAIFAADQIDDENAAHLIACGLIEPFDLPTPEEEGTATTGSSEHTDPYKEASVKDLKAELTKRNEGRSEDAKIVPAEPGNRPEIVAALAADDAKQQAQA